jgi:sulfur-carrier protein
MILSPTLSCLAFGHARSYSDLMANVFIPSLLRDLTGGSTTVTVDGATLREVIQALEVAYPGLAARICEGDRLRRGLTVAVDGTVTRSGLRQPVGPESEVHFLPSVRGG